MLKGEKFIKIYPSEVKKIGLHEAIIVSLIRGWLETNEKSNKNYFKEKYWTYFTHEELEEQTGVSKNTMRPKIKRLGNSGVIDIDNFNKRKNDRTNWYSLADNYNDIINQSKVIETINSNDDNDQTNCSNPSSQGDVFDATLPNNIDIKSHNTKIDYKHSTVGSDEKLDDFFNQIIKYFEPEENSNSNNQDEITNMITVLLKKHKPDKIVLVLYNRFINSPYKFYATPDEIMLIEKINIRLKTIIKL